MTKEEFTERFKAGIEGLKMLEVCKRLKVSKPTFYRWVSGKSAPHELGRESAIALVENMKKSS